MATTENTFTGDGSLTDYNFTFEYLKESDIKASVNGVVTTAFTLPSATLLRFNTAPANSALIRIYRDTATDTPYATFVSGSSIRAQDLNNNSTQMLFSAQERVNFNVGREGGTISTGNLNLENTNIVFDGSTKDSNKTTLTVTDPTASRSIKLPNQSGTVPVLAADSNTAITSTPEELNILDGVTASATELNIMDGVTASTAELNIMDGVTASTAELNIMDGVTASTGELNIIDGVTASTAELNLMDGVTASTAELNYVDGVTSNVQTQLDGKQPLDAELTELSTMGSNTAAALADLTQAEVQILDGATLSTSELNFVDGVTSGIQSQLDSKQPLDSELTELATMASTTASALADLTQAEVQTLDGVTASTAEINKLDGVTATTAELNYVDGVTSNVQTQLNAKQPLDAELTELATMASNTASALADLTNTEVQILDGATVSTTELNTLDGVNSSLSAADLNQLDSNSLTTSATWSSDTQFPSAANIDARITARIDPIDGFVAIADEDSFPATTPPEGTAVSISNAGGMVIGASASTTDASRAGGSDTVTIQNIPTNMQSQTVQDGIGMVVIATSTAHTYDFHRVIATNADVITLSNDINDFNNRYRIGSSNPTTDNDAGDLFFNTGNNKMLVRNSANNAWEEVQSVGNFFIVPSTDFPTWNGSLNDISLSANAPANAEQILLSLNGVVQQPVDGTARPSSGFSLNGSTIQLSAAPAAGTAAFAVILGSTVNIGTPSNDTITNAMVTSSAAIAGTKISPNFGSQDIVTTGDVGIGTTSPSQKLHISNNAALQILLERTGGNAGSCVVGNEGNHLRLQNNVDGVEFRTGSTPSQKMLINSSGRLLVGHSSSRQVGDRTHSVQVENTALSDGGFSVIRNRNDEHSTSITVAKTRGSAVGANTIVSDNDFIGEFAFAAADGTDCVTRTARIVSQVEGSPAANNVPGDLQFWTNSGASSPTLRMRIDSSGDATFTGYVGAEGGNAPTGGFHIKDTGGTTRPRITNDASNATVIRAGSATGGVKFNNFANSSELAVIDNSGRLLIGRSSSWNVSGFEPSLQVGGTNYETSAMMLGRWSNDTGAPTFIFHKSRGANINTNTDVQDGDILGRISFYGADGSDYEEAARIQCQVDGTVADGGDATDMPGRLVFLTTPNGDHNAVERMRITSGGAVKLVAASNVDVIYSYAAATGTSAAVFRGGHSATVGSPGTGTDSVFIFANGNIQNTNNSYGSISDVKLKENIVDANSQWNDIKQLQVRNYNFKEDTGHETHKQLGLIAQEAETVSPGLVYETSDVGVDGKELGTVTKKLNYSVLYMKAVKALQEAMTRIETLETKIAALEAK